MSEDQKQSGPPPNNAPSAGSKGRLLDWLDVVAKLVGAAAVLVVALIANTFQSKLTGASIQTQREQAESQLRANMFSSLINPLAGPQKDGISPEREELLAELLALNFYENFELKPLLEDASRRLVDLRRSGPDPREPLWSIARRISQRQKDAIAWEWNNYNSELAEQRGPLGRLFHREGAAQQPSAQACQFYAVTVPPPQQPRKSAASSSVCTEFADFRSLVTLYSPDRKYTLLMTLVGSDWENQSVKVSAVPFPSTRKFPLSTDPAYIFQISWFNFPFTDNILLPDGNRFAIYLQLVSPPQRKVEPRQSAPNRLSREVTAPPGQVTVIVMWFPKSYFTPRERPLNYQEVQELLGKKSH